MLFLLCLLLRSSFVSVVFDFNASLNDVAPTSPTLLPVDLMRMEKGELLMDVICVLLLLSSPNRLSFVSVVFDFNASPNDVAPVSPILFPVFVTKKQPCENFFSPCVFSVAKSDLQNRLLSMEGCSSKDKISQSSIRPRFPLPAT